MMLTKDILLEFQKKLSLQRYAQSSIKSYSNSLAKFLIAFEGFSLNKVKEQNIENFLYHLQKTENISSAYQKQILSAIGKYYELFHCRKLDLKYLYPKRKQKSLPKYLTRNEVVRLISACKNIKHKCVMKLLYGCGLRVGEVLNLRLRDVNSDQMLLHISMAKGNKDRIVKLPSIVLDDLRVYYKKYKPKDFLFEGQNKPFYSAKSIQNFIKKYALEAKITKTVTPHMLRHSYATHLVESGIDIRFVKELLGHNSIKTTEIYTHISDITKSKFMSPIEHLDL
ncbi:site-specific tyrosine recombinase/integron integrase [Aquimarina sp. 2201CG14-23]|uniref:site-specific tyrosine recombinase/integron integrase n=1 Tax=Aquimarina mycalae TaxID=3040073 RepID=UPI002477FE93|nr:site-specific tyrosine recombinase/integron integrase [Aquimarina sp. 2201CG14-23]MDH7448457.1 tyrosine-type recombinase/integrase [Aquimarina sp. 2201CG14-23]